MSRCLAGGHESQVARLSGRVIDLTPITQDQCHSPAMVFGKRDDNALGCGLRRTHYRERNDFIPASLPARNRVRSHNNGLDMQRMGKRKRGQRDL